MAVSPATTMWGIYDFQGHRVEVVQQWRDPYGRAMVRVQTTGPGPERSTGLAEDDFLREAVAWAGS